MDNFQTFILLMFLASLLVSFSQKIHIPYPISLILGGAAIGFNSYLHPIFFDPNLILLIVLPPVLYYSAFGIFIREFKRNWREILSLALGLVLITTLIVGMLFKWLFPDLPWALAFAFGAIISPPDAIAATTILKRFSISNRLLTILEGESLVNDASALVLYRIAVVALVSGTFSFSEASVNFVKVVLGGVFVGAILGLSMQAFSRRYLEPVVGVVFSFTIPYITYILADVFGFSGVLAVVTNGLIGSQILLRHPSSLRRILGYAVWDIFVILLNCFVFILIGLQLRSLTSMMTYKQILTYSMYAFIIMTVMVIIRVLWVYAKNSIAYYQAKKHPESHAVCSRIVRESVVIAWAGMRGIVSLTAALALPYMLPNGMPLEGRNEVIFITFVVILLTLLIPGLTLPYLIQRLKIHHQPEYHLILKVKKQLMKVAEEALMRLHKQKKINETEFKFLKKYFNLQHRVYENIPKKQLEDLEEAKRIVVKEQRKKLFEIWDSLEIDDKLLLELEQELDITETHLARAELV